jgi:hypothetical protein
LAGYFTVSEQPRNSEGMGSWRPQQEESLQTEQGSGETAAQQAAAQSTQAYSGGTEGGEVQE